MSFCPCSRSGRWNGVGSAPEQRWSGRWRRSRAFQRGLLSLVEVVGETHRPTIACQGVTDRCGWPPRAVRAPHGITQLWELADTGDIAGLRPHADYERRTTAFLDRARSLN